MGRSGRAGAPQTTSALDSRYSMILLFLFLSLIYPSSSSVLSKAKVSLVDAVIFPYPVSPPSTFTAAVVEVTSSDKVMVNAGGCGPSPNGGCSNAEMFVRCCKPSECDPSHRPLNKSATCVCATRADRVCIDPWTPLEVLDDSYLELNPWNAVLAFEIPIRASCNTVILDTGSLIGDWDIYLNPITPSLQQDFTTTFLTATTLGPDSMALCANETNVHHGYVGANSLSSWMQNLAIDGIPRITGYLNGYGQLRFTVKGLISCQDWAGARSRHNFANQIIDVKNERGFVDYAEGAHYKLAPITMNCSNEITTYRLSSPPFLPTWLMPTHDPAFDTLLSLSCLKQVTPQNYKPGAIALMFSLAQDAISATTPSFGSLEGCSLDLSAFADSTGPLGQVSIENPTETTPVCRLKELLALKDSFVNDTLQAKMLLNTTNSAMQSLSAVLAAPGLQASVAWASCLSFSKSFLEDGPAVAVSGKFCYETPNTPEYAADPCCTVDLEWESCCVAQERSVSRPEPNFLQIAEECTNPQCVSNIASSLATYQRTDMQCREEGVAAQLEVVNPFSGGMNGKIFGPCHNEYRYGTDDAKLLECANTYLDDLYKAEFFALWGIMNVTTNWMNFTAAWYFREQGCVQPGVSYVTDFGLGGRDTQLDSNIDACLNTPSCNWGDPQMGEAACLHSSRGSMMCASCSESYCTDFTVPAACYMSWGIASSLTPLEQCTILGGVLDPELTCWFNNITTRDACIPPTHCNVSEDVCASYCYFENITDSAQCNCTAYNGSLHLPCGRAVWNSLLNRCSVNETTMEVCSNYEGTFWHGAAWQEGVMATETDCQSYCIYDRSITNEAECNALAPKGSCTVNCPGCNQATCEGTMGCDDMVLYNGGNGACVTEFLNFGSTFAACGASSINVPGLGCVWTDDSSVFTAQQVCDFLKLPITHSHNKSAECEAYGRCQEDNFSPDVTTPKNRTECERCNGTWIQAFHWGSGKWIPIPPSPVWQNLTWTSRNYTNRYYNASFFDREWFMTDFLKVLAGVQSRAVKKVITCRGAGLLDLVTSLSCRCGTISDNSCQPIEAYQVLIRTRACLATLNQHYPFGQLNESVTMINANYSPSCADLAVEEVDTRLFERKSLVEASSILVQVLAPNRNSIVVNNRGVVVGMLAGNGTRIVLDENIKFYNGTYELCLKFSEYKPQQEYTTASFAIFDPSSKKWHILDAIHSGAERCNDAVCCSYVPMDKSVIVFPVRRVPHPERHTFADSLVPSVRRTVIACAVLYGILLLGSLFLLVTNAAQAIVAPASRPDSIQLCVLYVALGIAALLRCIYYALFHEGHVTDTSSGAVLLLVDLPFFLNATAFSILISRWANLYHKHLTEGHVTLPMNSNLIEIIAGSLNFLLYALFFAVLFTISLSGIPSKNGESACMSGDSSEKEQRLRILAKAYRTIEAVVATLLAIGFCVYRLKIEFVYRSAMSQMRRMQQEMQVQMLQQMHAQQQLQQLQLQQQLQEMQQQQPQQQQQQQPPPPPPPPPPPLPPMPNNNRNNEKPFMRLLHVTGVIVACAVSLVLQAAIFLYATYTRQVSDIFVILTLLLVEFVPVVAMFFMRRPTHKKVFPWENDQVTPELEKSTSLMQDTQSA